MWNTKQQLQGGKQQICFCELLILLRPLLKVRSVGKNISRIHSTRAYTLVQQLPREFQAVKTQNCWLHDADFPLSSLTYEDNQLKALSIF